MCHLCYDTPPLALAVVDTDLVWSPVNFFYIGPDQTRLTPAVERTKKYSITICVSPIFGNFSDVLGLVEWVELNRILGVDFFVFYVTDISINCKNILEYYVKTGIALIVPWNILKYVKAEELDYYGQQAATNDCLQRVKWQSDYLLSIDLDEFVIPKKQTDFTLFDIMFALPEFSVLMFRHALYFNVNGKSKGQGKLKTQRDVCRTSEVQEKGVRSKILMKPEAVLKHGVHDTWENIFGEEIVVDPEIALLHHYRKNSGYAEGQTLFVVDSSAKKYQNMLENSIAVTKKKLKQLYTIDINYK